MSRIRRFPRMRCICRILTPHCPQHLLRGEPGIYYEDLYPLVCFLPRYATHAPEIQADEDMLPLWKASEIARGPQGVARVTAPKTSAQTQDLKQTQSAPSAAHAGGDSSWLDTMGRRKPKHQNTFDPEKGVPRVRTTVRVQ